MSDVPPTSERRLRIGLFVGVLLLFLAVWKGDGGYHDLREYLDNAENLWLKGDLSIPGKPGEYYFHPLGIAVLSGPFVLAGAAIEKVSGGAISHRAIAALCIPIFSALACLILYRIGRLLEFSPIISLWTAVIVAIGSPMLVYTRLFYTEAGIAMGLSIAIWAYLKWQRAPQEQATGWMLLTGTGLAAVGACHFNNAFVTAWLWIAISVAIFSQTSCSMNLRLRQFVALTVIPILAASALLYMNARRFGSPFLTGYEKPLEIESPHPVSLLNIPRNFLYFPLWLVHVPWVIAAFIYLGKLRTKQPALAAGIALAVLSHIALFQVFTGTRGFPIRYMQTAAIILTTGLLFFADALWRRWHERGLFYAGVLLVCWSQIFFHRPETSAPAFIFPQMGDNVSAGPPFLLSPTGEVNAHVWYMLPPPSNGVRSAMGATQWIVLAFLLVAGFAALAIAFRDAHRISCEAERR